jgi:peptide/nickel transport system substrate-binding protein
LTRQLRNAAAVIAAAAVVAVVAVFGWRQSSRAPAATAVRPGGDLVVSIRGEPRTFNRFAGRDQTTDLIAMLTQAKLVRINRATQEVEPWLAERWTRSDNGLRYTVALRPSVTFSDGHPFTADDVVFSFEAAYDARTGGPLGDALEVGGRRLEVTAPDPQTVVVDFPSSFGPGLRILDNLPIVPRHVLQAALDDGTFARAWGVGTPPGDIVGLGPFVLAEYHPGERVVFARNPRYWRVDAAGTPLPYLDRVTLEIVPDQDAEILRLESGQIDMTADTVRPEDYARLKRAAEAGRITLLDLGVGLDADSLWFNLKPGAFQGDSRGAWLQRGEWRRAVSMAVDRQLFAETVFLGAGVPVFGPVTPANKKWYAADVPHAPYDPAQARALLASIGLVDRNGDGVLEDAMGRSAQFTLITIKGNTSLDRGAALIRDELKQIGVVVDVAALDQPAVVQRFLSGAYDAVYFHLVTSDTDPAINLDFWMSSGSAHVWNLGQQTPATDWERRIDELMARQTASTDEDERRRLFNEVQRLFADRLPVISFVAPRIFVATSSRVTNLTPSVSRPQLLWAPDMIAMRGDPRRVR